MRRHAKAFVVALTLLVVVGVATAIADTAPTPEIEAPSEIKYTTAHLEGKVNPNAGPSITHWHFEFSEDPLGEGWSQAPDHEMSQAESEESSALSVEEDLGSGTLQPDTKYFVRLVASNDGGEGASAEEELETEAVAKPSITPIAVSSLTDTSAHFSAEVDPNGADPAFDAEWIFTCTPACKDAKGHPLSGEPVSGAAEEVSADAAQLEPNTPYTVMLTASNAGGSEEKSASFETSGKAPSVNAFAAGPIQATQASINGTVNPHNSPTTYWFEWGSADCSANPCQAIPATKDADAGSGSFNVYVSRQLSGLNPESTYHFRLIAQNASDTTKGPDQTFTTASLASEAQGAACPNSGALGTSQLPNCRAWEMVSPPDKNGANVGQASDRTHAAADGNGIAFAALLPFGDARGTALDVEYLAQRDAAPETNGWSTHAITPKQPSDNLLGGEGGLTLYQGDFSADLSRAVYSSWRPLTDAPNVAPVPNIYLRSDLTSPGAGSYRLLSDSATPVPTFPPPFSEFSPLVETYLQGAQPRLADASADFEHVIFETGLGLTADTTMPSAFEVASAPRKLFENAEGELRYVGRVPTSGASCDDAEGPTCEAAESSQAGLGVTKKVYTEHTISRDGSRIFFTTPAGGFEGALYMREDGERTYQLNASEKASPDSPQPAEFWDASADGSRAFFSTNESLVEEDEDTAPDLYLYDRSKPEGERLTLVSASSVADGYLETVIGAGGDGHYVYFVSDGQLVAGEPPSSILGLYLWHDGELSYIGRFPSLGVVVPNSPKTLWNYIVTTRTSRISPDGRHLLFATTSDEGFQGRGGFSGYEQNEHHELYTYDADRGRLRCASCNPSGTPASADAFGDSRFDGSLGLIQSNQHVTHALSDDGRYAFFSTEGELVPEDTNGTWDAYTYDSRREEVRLLSTGEDKQGSYFLDASADGRDAFFTTAQPLSRWDTDNAFDIYVARVGGGLPEPKLPPPSCQGDACQPAPRELNDPTPASSSFKRAGNATSSRCPRGKRKVKARNGKSRCVKRHAKKRSHGHNRHAHTNRRAGR